MLWVILVPGATANQGAVLVVGDSISAAYGMSLEQGWVTLLAEDLADSKPGYTVVNASISGDTTAGGLRRLPALLEEHQPYLVIIELGGNDGLRGYPIPSLRENLRQMITLSHAAGAKALVLGGEIPPNYGSRYTSAFRESFPLVAEELGASYGPFIMQHVATDSTLMQADGIHPTVEAQSKMLETVLPAIKALL